MVVLMHMSMAHFVPLVERERTGNASCLMRTSNADAGRRHDKVVSVREAGIEPSREIRGLVHKAAARSPHVAGVARM